MSFFPGISGDQKRVKTIGINSSHHFVSFRGVTRCLTINSSEDTKDRLNY